MIKKNGFTIFEILIVIGIMTLLSAIMVSYYNNYSENEKLQNESQKFISVLSLAQKKAKAAELAEEDVCKNNQYIGYQVVINSESEYVLQRNCMGQSTEEQEIKSYSLPNGMKILSEISQVTTILYKKLSQGVLINGESVTRTITIENTSINKCFDITINKAGVITKTLRNDCIGQ